MDAILLPAVPLQMSVSVVCPSVACSPNPARSRSSDSSCMQGEEEEVEEEEEEEEEEEDVSEGWQPHTLNTVSGSGFYLWTHEFK